MTNPVQIVAWTYLSSICCAEGCTVGSALLSDEAGTRAI